MYRTFSLTSVVTNRLLGNFTSHKHLTMIKVTYLLIVTWWFHSTITRFNAQEINGNILPSLWPLADRNTRHYLLAPDTRRSKAPINNVAKEWRACEIPRVQSSAGYGAPVASILLFKFMRQLKKGDKTTRERQCNGWQKEEGEWVRILLPLNLRLLPRHNTTAASNRSTAAPALIVAQRPLGESRLDFCALKIQHRTT